MSEFLSNVEQQLLNHIGESQEVYRELISHVGYLKNIEVKRQAETTFKNNLEGSINVANALGQVGAQLGNEPLQQISKIGLAGSQIAGAYAALSAGGISSLAAAGHVGLIAMGALSIINVLSQDEPKENNTLQIFAEVIIKTINDQFANTNNNIIQLFKTNFKNQKDIIETTKNLFKHLSNKLDRQFESTASMLSHLEDSLHQLGISLLAGQKEIFLQSFKADLSIANAWIAGSLKENKKSEIPKVAETLMRRIKLHGGVSELLTGKNLIPESTSKDSVYDWINTQALPNTTSGTLDFRVGFLARYAKNLGANISNESLAAIYNVRVQELGVRALHQLGEDHAMYMTDLSDAEIKSIFTANTLNEQVYKGFQEKQIYEKLFDLRKEALQEIQTLLRKSIDEQNASFISQVGTSLNVEDLPKSLSFFMGALPDTTNVEGRNFTWLQRNDVALKQGVLKPINYVTAFADHVIEPEFILLNRLKMLSFDMPYDVEIPPQSFNDLTLTAKVTVECNASFATNTTSGTNCWPLFTSVRHLVKGQHPFNQQISLADNIFAWNLGKAKGKENIAHTSAHPEALQHATAALKNLFLAQKKLAVKNVLESVAYKNALSKLQAANKLMKGFAYHAGFKADENKLLMELYSADKITKELQDFVTTGNYDTSLPNPLDADSATNIRARFMNIANNPGSNYFQSPGLASIEKMTNGLTALQNRRETVVKNLHANDSNINFPNMVQRYKKGFRIWSDAEFLRNIPPEIKKSPEDYQDLAANLAEIQKLLTAINKLLTDSNPVKLTSLADSLIKLINKCSEVHTDLKYLSPNYAKKFNSSTDFAYLEYDRTELEKIKSDNLDTLISFANSASVNSLFNNSNRSISDNEEKEIKYSVSTRNSSQ